MNGNRRKAVQGNSRGKTERDELSQVESTIRYGENCTASSNSQPSEEINKLHTQEQWSERQKNNNDIYRNGKEENSCSVFVSNDNDSNRSNQNFLVNDDDNPVGINVIVNDFNSHFDADCHCCDITEGLSLLLTEQLSMRSSTSSIERSSSSSSIPSLLSSLSTPSLISSSSENNTSDDSDEINNDDGNISSDTCPPLVSSEDDINDSDVSDSNSSEISEDGSPWPYFHDDSDEDVEGYSSIALDPFQFPGFTFSDFVNGRLQQIENGFDPDSHPLLFQFLVEMLQVFSDDERIPEPAPRHVIEALPKDKIIQSQVDAGETCCICCAIFKLDEEILKLHCSHLYHNECIKQWLMLRPTCPTCRRDISETNHSGQDLTESAV